MSSALSLVRVSEACLPEALRSHFEARVRTAPAWISKQSEPHIRTVGLPLYKAVDVEEYNAFATNVREYFAREFRTLYEFVLDVVRSATGQTANLSPSLALPGFHVISGSQDQPFWGGTFHRDAFSHKLPQVTNLLLSGTLLLSPEEGSHSLEFEGGINHGPVLVNHEPGRVTLFLPDHPHRIGPIRAAEEPSDRITMQFHVRVKNDVNELFW